MTTFSVLKVLALATVACGALALGVNHAPSWPFTIVCYIVMGVGVLGLVVLS